MTDKELIYKEMYSSGISAKEIAQKFHVHSATVWRTLKRQRVPLRGTGNYIRADEEKARLRKMAERIRPKFQMGIHVSPETEFKPGLTPWNKGKKRPEISGENHPSRRPEHIETYKRIWAMPKVRMKGDKHPQWKGGKTPLIMKIRNSPEYGEWRKKIFERDDYTCFVCGDRRGRNLNAHHIKLLSDSIHRRRISTFTEALKVLELWDVKEGITLCEKCHPSANEISKITAILNTQEVESNEQARRFDCIKE